MNNGLNYYGQPITPPEHFDGLHVANPGPAGQPPVCSCGWTPWGEFTMADHLRDMGRFAGDYSVTGPGPNGYAVLHEASGSYAADGLELDAAKELAETLNQGHEAPAAPRCPGCGRVMSNREATEQGACNDCSGGAYDPRDGGDDR